MEWLKAKAKVEGWTWAVTAGVALMLSAGASSPVPGQFMLAMEAMFLAYTLNQAKEMNRPSVPEPVTRDLRELWELCISTVHEVSALLSDASLLCWAGLTLRLAAGSGGLPARLVLRRAGGLHHARGLAGLLGLGAVQHHIRAALQHQPTCARRRGRNL
eukprot:1360148-Rhodomonas_salina.1